MDIGDFYPIMDEMMLLLNDEFNYALAENFKASQLFATGMFQGISGEFTKHIKKDQDPSAEVGDLHKLYFYSDHDDSGTILSYLLGHKLTTYPPFATQFLFELWKKDGKYFVTTTRNGF